MKQPSLDVLMSKVDSKYTLVVVAAKRARTLMEEQTAEGVHHGAKPVSIALDEIARGRLHFQQMNDGTK